MPPEHPTHRYFLWLTLLVIALALLGFGFGFSLLSFTPAPAPAVERYLEPPKPADYVSAQRGFQYFVSYTDNGFVPDKLTVKKGETVRFTGNSSAPFQLTVAGATAQVSAKGEYFEYTFAKTGTFTYGDGTKKGIVTVK